MRRLAFFLVALALGACSGDDGSRVVMTPGQRFEPSVLQVAAGTTVTFVNESAEGHTVTAVGDAPRYFSSGGFESEDQARDNVGDALIPPDDAYEFTFDEPGTYDYVCIPHEEQGMKGTIEVEG